MSQTKAQLVDAVDGSIVDADIVGLSSSKLSGSLPAISGSALTGISTGISDFDTWYLTASHSGNTNPIINNWSRWTQYSGEGSVTFSAPSSGIWTFPSTGYWKIDFTVYNQSDGNNSERGCNTNMYITTNNSSYVFVGESSTSLVKADDNTNISKGYTMLSYVFDVTDTSTHKVKFANGYNQRAGTVLGHGAYLYTHVKFIKLKDT